MTRVALVLPRMVQVALEGPSMAKEGYGALEI